MTPAVNAAKSLLRNVLGSWPCVPGVVRRAALRAGRVGVGEGARVLAGQHFTHGRVSFGDRAFINRGCSFDAAGDAEIRIGNDVAVGVGGIFAAITHEIGPSTGRAGAGTGATIRVGDGAWLGARVTVLPGVTIGAGAVIAAGAVVTADCEPNCLYAGVPAVMKRRLDTPLLTRLASGE